MRPNRWLIFPSLLAMACVGPEEIAAADADDSSSSAVTARALEAKPQGIVFAHLRFTPDRVEILKSHIAPGRLKPGAERRGERVLLQVLSADGRKLWEGSMANPDTEIFEGPEGSTGGRQETRVIRHSSREITVRVPFFFRDQMLRVLRVPTGEGAVAESKVLGVLQLPKDQP
jgi:hypothetical protein